MSLTNQEQKLLIDPQDAILGIDGRTAQNPDGVQDALKHVIWNMQLLLELYTTNTRVWQNKTLTFTQAIEGLEPERQEIKDTEDRIDEGWQRYKDARSALNDYARNYQPPP